MEKIRIQDKHPGSSLNTGIYYRYQVMQVLASCRGTYGVYVTTIILKTAVEAKIKLLDYYLRRYYNCAAHIGMDGMRIEKEPRQKDEYVYRIS
jgi:hypothetical protein